MKRSTPDGFVLTFTQYCRYLVASSITLHTIKSRLAELRKISIDEFGVCKIEAIYLITWMSVL